MNRTFLITPAVLSGLAVALTARPTAAADTVVRKSTERAASGEITSVSRTEVVVTPRLGDAVTVPANDIAEVQWDEAPAAFGAGRSQEASGQLELALNSYQQAASESAGDDPNLRADLRFRIARVKARLALGDPEQLAEAIAELKQFVESQRDHYFFYDAQLLLAETALAADDFTTAGSAYDVVAAAPWNDYQMAGKIGGARLLFARGDVAGARQVFDEVASVDAATPAEHSQKLQAMLGQAMCLQEQGDHQQAVETLDQVVQQSSEGDTRLQAEAYVRQGESLVAAGDDPKRAVMAFLHVDVVPALAEEADLHAEALYHLSQLWPAVGQPGRGAEAAARLQELYPNSQWTAKLAGGGAG